MSQVDFSQVDDEILLNDVDMSEDDALSLHKSDGVPIDEKLVEKS